MTLKKLGKKVGRAFAVAGIVSNLNASPPHGLDTRANQVDQFSSYSAQVRLPETRRQVKRQTDKQLQAVAALDKRVKKQIKKSGKG